MTIISVHQFLNNKNAISFEAQRRRVRQNIEQLDSKQVDSFVTQKPVHSNMGEVSSSEIGAYSTQRRRVRPNIDQNIQQQVASSMPQRRRVRPNLEQMNLQQNAQSVENCRKDKDEFFVQQESNVRQNRTHEKESLPDYVSPTYFQTQAVPKRSSTKENIKHKPIDSFKVEQRRPTKKTKFNTRMAAFISAAALASATSGVAGYAIGKNVSDKDTYLEGFEAGKQSVIVENQENSNIREIPMPISTMFVETPTPAPVEVKQEIPIPQKVLTLAPDVVSEFALSEKPFLNDENSKVPQYFVNNNISFDTLKTAQQNCARVFESGGYIIISPKQDVTMGEIKRLFGIIDEVIGKEPLNELQTRPQIDGSNGNLDNAILGQDDAIRIKKFTPERGHQVGVYEAHKSNKSRQKIADEILKWANK